MALLEVYKGGAGVDLRLELYCIERKLDHTLLDRNEWRKLTRRRRVIKRRLAGRDPRHFVGVSMGRVPREMEEQYRIKRCVVRILEELGGDNGK